MTSNVSRADSAAVIKRSLTIAGHRTSISLEDAFWTRLKSVAKTREKSLSALIAEIDASRGEANLSSAIRVFVLESFSQ
ncbi:MAG TPA: ribbon-helix-helix domain-containing protein [Roseiarcus sp.]